jgi:hypothetical protein
MPITTSHIASLLAWPAMSASRDRPGETFTQATVELITGDIGRQVGNLGFRNLERTWWRLTIAKAPWTATTTRSGRARCGLSWHRSRSRLLSR